MKTIEEIRESELNPSQAYLNACDVFEIKAVKFIEVDSFLLRKFVNEISQIYDTMKSTFEEYVIYSLAKKCEGMYNEAEKIYLKHTSNS